MVQAQMKTVNVVGVWCEFNNRTSDEQVFIFHYAIDAMKADCTRSKTECIALAMGFEKIGENLWVIITK